MEEFLAFITDHTPDGDYIVSETAEKIAAAADNDIPLVLADVRQRLVVKVIADHLRLVQAARRAQGHRLARRADFEEKVAESVALGDTSPFTVDMCVDDKLTRRRVGDMTGADHLFVADGYAARSKTAALLARFHQAVAKKVGERRTSEVLSEEDYLRMQSSILRAAA